MDGHQYKWQSHIRLVRHSYYCDRASLHKSTLSRARYFLLISFAQLPAGYDPACRLKIEPAPSAVLDELGLYVIDLSFYDLRHMCEERILRVHDVWDRIHDSSLFWTTGRAIMPPKLPTCPLHRFFGVAQLSSYSSSPFLLATLFRRDVNTKVGDNNAGIPHIIAHGCTSWTGAPGRWGEIFRKGEYRHTLGVVSRIASGLLRLMVLGWGFHGFCSWPFNGRWAGEESVVVDFGGLF